MSEWWTANFLPAAFAQLAARNSPFAIPLSLKRKISGGALAFIGFLLSPLSWWNDLFVNVPLALAFAWLVSWLWPAAFGVSFVVGYWLTNILGLVLMQKGAQQALAEQPEPYTRRALLRDLGISLV